MRFNLFFKENKMNQIFEEKDNQIRLLKNIISLNEEQSKNQKNLIDSLKKVYIFLY